MLITMLETRCASEDGFTLRRLQKYVEYNLADTLARDLIRRGHAIASRYFLSIPKE